MTLAVLVAAAFVAAEGGEELRLFQTTPAKDFREIVSDGNRPHFRRRIVIKYKGLYKTLPFPGGMISVSTLVFK